MRTYERSDVTVDQCSECRGIFLDRGARAADRRRHPTASCSPAGATASRGYPSAVPASGLSGPGAGVRPAPKGPYKERRSFLEDLLE